MTSNEMMCDCWIENADGAYVCAHPSNCRGVPISSTQEAQMAYSDKYGTFYGIEQGDGNVVVLHVEDGLAATRLDASVWPIGSKVSARYDHPQGIILSREDAEKLGLQIHR